MSRRELPIDDLAEQARSLGLEMSRERLEAALPEVRRVLAQAEMLRALPLAPGQAGADEWHPPGSGAPSPGA